MLVSIITPTFNHEKYLSKCIESAISQTFSDWEMIIIDDGSTDGTAEIAQSYCKLDERIRYYHQQNKGLERLKETYNWGLEISKGEYIAILEGDDYWYSDKLALQTQILEERKDVILSWGRVDLVSENEKKTGYYPQGYSESKLDFYNNKKRAGILNIIFEDFPVPLTWLVRKSGLDKIGGFLQSEKMPTVDRDTLYELSLHGQFHYFNEPLGAYRRPITQATKRLTVEIMRGCCDIVSRFYENLSTEDKENVFFDDTYIIEKCKEQMTVAYSRYGRSCLVRKEFKEARKNYFLSLEGNPWELPVWKLRSLIGLLFSYFHTDIEVLAKLLGKKTYD